MAHCDNSSVFSKIYRVLFEHNYPLPDYEDTSNCPPTKHLPLNEDVHQMNLGPDPSKWGLPNMPQTNKPDMDSNQPTDIGGPVNEPIQNPESEPIDPHQHEAIQHGHAEIGNQIDWALHDDEHYEEMANELYQQSTYIPEGVLDQLRQGDQIETPETYEEYELEHETYNGPNPYNIDHDSISHQPQPLDNIESVSGSSNIQELPDPVNNRPNDRPTNIPPVNQDTDDQKPTQTNTDTQVNTIAHTGSIYVYGYDGSTICRCPTWSTFNDANNINQY